MVALWHLLLLLCVGVCIGGALGSAEIIEMGFGGYTLAISVGLVLGLCCAWTMQVVGAMLSTRIKRQRVQLRERYSRALYFAAMLWMVFAWFLSGWVSFALLRLVF
jgi:hypothetical protein